MAADSGARLQNVHPWMVVGQLNELPHIDPQAGANDRQFVSEGDINVAVRVFDQLRHFSGLGIRDVHCPFAKYAVEVACHFCGGAGKATYNPVVGNELDHDPAWKHTLWTMCNMEHRLS